MLLDDIKKKQKELRIKARSDVTGDITVQKMILTTLIGELEGLAKKKVVDDLVVQQVITKFVKNNKETQLHTTDQGMARTLFLENEILEGFLPKQMTEEQLREVVSGIMKEFNDGGHTVSMGLVMGRLKTLHGGAYDGRLASAVVKEMLK